MRKQITTVTTVTTLDGETARVRLPAPFYTAEARGVEDAGVGAWITGLFYAPRSGRCYVKTYSVWEDRRTGGCVGTRKREVSPGELAELCRRVGADVPAGLDEKIALEA